MSEEKEQHLITRDQLQALLEASAAGDMGSSEALNDYLGILKDLLKAGYSHVVSSDTYDSIKAQSGAALLNYALKAKENLPGAIAGKVAAAAEKTGKKVFDLPDRAIKRTLDAILGKQKARMRLNKAILDANLISEAYGKAVAKQVDAIKEQLNKKEVTPGQAVALLKQIVLEVESKLKAKKHGHSSADTRVTVHVA